jgi:hypothetical protein
VRRVLKDDPLVAKRSRTFSRLSTRVIPPLPRRYSLRPTDKAEEAAALRYGLYWQIAPSILGDMMKDPDRMRAKRVAEAMLNMVKLDIERLQSAYEGRSA